MPQDQEANEKPIVLTADASDVDLNVNRSFRIHCRKVLTLSCVDQEESESGAQAQRENEKPMAMSVDAAGDDLIVSSRFQSLSKFINTPYVKEEVTELVPTDQENDVEPVMSVDTVDDSIVSPLFASL